jgi:hypothetical protein
MCRPLLWTALIFAVAACDNDEDFIGAPPGNSLPTTRLTALPPVLHGSSSQVSISWSGTDLDGQIVGFDWKMTDNGADGIADAEDLLEQAWRFTTASDSTFRVSADMDSFPEDLDPPSQWPRFWQTHTFFVRAVDDQDARDPSPAEVSFTAVTIAPSVNIVEPASVPSNSCRGASRIMRFAWNVFDADALEGDALETRHVLLPLNNLFQNCLSQDRYEAANLIGADTEGWSAWTPYDSSLAGAYEVTYPPAEMGDRFVFAVQARDPTGAVTPTFRWNRNVRHVQVTDIYPSLYVGSRAFVSTGALLVVNAFPNREFELGWSARADSYGGVIKGYRFGWDVHDPNNPQDSAWAGPWGLGEQFQQTRRALDPGTYSLTIQCRDHADTVSQVRIIIGVLQLPSLADQRPLLLVDDWREVNRPDPMDRQWDDEWRVMLEDRVNGFDALTDVVEASISESKLGIESLARYRGIIWFGNPDASSYLHRQAESSAGQFPGRLDLDLYQSSAGNLFLVGPGIASSAVSPSRAEYWLYPLVFDTAEGGPLGFGSGWCGYPPGPIILGRNQWPYVAWCLDAIDRVRPSIGGVWGEHDRTGVQIRSKGCDGLYRAVLSDEFRAEFPAAAEPPFGVRDLTPGPARRASDSLYRVTAEEFYNVNVTSRPIAIQPRDCQIPMFRWVSRRDYDDWVLAELGELVPPIVENDSLNCLPIGSTQTAFHLAPTGIVSSVYSDQKPILGSHDFLWGFHPLSFERDTVEAAVHWILGEDWQLDVN